VASFDSFGNLGKYEEPIVILREAGCAFGGGGIKYFASVRNLTPNFRHLVQYQVIRE